jgi:DNA-binding MarR family transcriptional regulator
VKVIMESRDFGQHSVLSELPRLRASEVGLAGAMYQLAEEAEAGDPENTGPWVSAIAKIVLDAVLRGEPDVVTFMGRALVDLRAALVAKADGRRDERVVVLEAMLEVTRAALSRSRQTHAVAVVGGDTVAARMLSFIAQNPGCSNNKIAEELKKDITEISRTGKVLREHALAYPSKSGRTNGWRLTPRGRQAFEAAQRRPRQQVSTGDVISADPQTLDEWVEEGRLRSHSIHTYAEAQRDPHIADKRLLVIVDPQGHRAWSPTGAPDQFVLLIGGSAPPAGGSGPTQVGSAEARSQRQGSRPALR